MWNCPAPLPTGSTLTVLALRPCALRGRSSPSPSARRRTGSRSRARPCREPATTNGGLPNACWTTSLIWPAAAAAGGAGAGAGGTGGAGAAGTGVVGVAAAAAAAGSGQDDARDRRKAVPELDHRPDPIRRDDDPHRASRELPCGSLRMCTSRALARGTITPARVSASANSASTSERRDHQQRDLPPRPALEAAEGERVVQRVRRDARVQRAGRAVEQAQAEAEHGERHEVERRRRADVHERRTAAR